MNWFIFALLAAVFTSCHTMLEKKALSQGRTLEVVWVLAIVNALLSIPLFFVVDFARVDLFVTGTIFVASLFGTGALFLATKSLKHAEVSETSPLFALSPLIAAALAFIFLGEKMTDRNLLGLLFIVGGIFILEIKNFQFSTGLFARGRERYLLYTVLAILLYGVSVMFDRIVLARYGVEPLAYLAIVHIALAINFSIIFLIMPLSQGELLKSLRHTWKLLFLIAAITYFQRYFYASAIQIAVSLGLVVAVKRLSTLFTVVIGGRLFHEHGITRKIVAAAIVILGTLLLVM